MLERKLSMYNN